MILRPERLDLEPGTKLADVQFGPVTRAMLALYAGASGDHDPVHIDTDFARKAGLADVFAHGMLVFGILSRVVTEPFGIDRLRALGGRFVAITEVHDLLTCSGLVTELFEDGGETRARIELRATTQDGRETLVGEAVVAVGAAESPSPLSLIASADRSAEKQKE